MMGELVGRTVLCTLDRHRESVAINNDIDAVDVVSLGSFLMDENGVPRIASSFYCPLTMTVMKDPVQDREGSVNVIFDLSLFSFFVWCCRVVLSFKYCIISDYYC